MTTEIKQRIVNALQQRRANFGGTDAKFAISMGISPAQYSRIKNGDIEQVLSDSNWISIARRLEVVLTSEPEWKTANTPVFAFITAQLEMCQHDGVSTLLCDMADIGKTYTAKIYARTHKNAVYVDCSQVKTKQKLIRFIAKEFGVNSMGRYSEVYADLVYYINSISEPLIILDEAGDLSYEAFLELKALWNATERCCAWYMMGADGLKAKIERSINCLKVGYTEIFSRYGKRYGRVTPEGRDDQERFTKAQAAMIIKANAPDVDVNKLINNTDGSLRRIYTEIKKLKKAA